MEIRVPRIEKNDKNRRSVFLSFLILETLIARIKKKIKKKEPLIFLFFLILEIIFGILEGQKLETIIFWFFQVFNFLVLETLISRIKKIKKRSLRLF